MSGRFDIGALGTILGVWAHPDDEAFLSGGVMAAARMNGQRVVVVTATRGELGTPDPRTWPPHRLAARREIELTRSLDALGVVEHVILGHPDGACAAIGIDIGSAQVAGAIDAVEPDTILTFGPDGYTGHTDHRTVSSWVDAAVSWTGWSTRVLQATASEPFLHRFADVHDRYDVFFAGQPSVAEPDELTIDMVVEGPLLDRKLAALRAQSSQTAGLISEMGVDRFREWIAAESFVEAHRSPLRTGVV